MAENSLTNDRSLLLDELQVLSGALADHVSSYYTTDCREEIERAVRVMREAHAALTGAVEPGDECARLRRVLTDLKERLIQVNEGMEMGGIDTELIATIDCALAENRGAKP